MKQILATLLFFIVGITLHAQQNPRFRFIGVEAGRDLKNYDAFDENAGFKKSYFKNVAPNSFYIPAEKGSFTKQYIPGGKQFPGGQSPSIGSYREKQFSKGWYINSLFQLRKKDGTYNKHHILKIGLGQSYRELLSGEFMGGQFVGIIDSLFSVQDTAITLPVQAYHTRYNSGRTNVSISQISLNLGYTYKMFTTNHFSLSVGGGINTGITYKGLFVGRYYNYDKLLFMPVGGGEYYFVTHQQRVTNHFAGGISVQPYVTASVSGRMSKTVPFFRSLNAFFELGAGLDYTKLKGGASTYTDKFISTRFGFTYIFNKYYNT